jgi:hypothetical protein
MRKDQNGYSFVMLLSALVIVLIMIFAGRYVIKAKQIADKNYNEAGTSNTSQSVQSDNLATLSGMVTQGPNSPVCGPTVDCNQSRPAVGVTLQAVNNDGKVVASDKTSVSGQYIMHLPVGHYSIKVASMPLAKSQNIDVHQGNNSLDVGLDTGIR